MRAINFLPSSSSVPIRFWATVLWPLFLAPLLECTASALQSPLLCLSSTTVGVCGVLESHCQLFRCASASHLWRIKICAFRTFSRYSASFKNSRVVLPWRRLSRVVSRINELEVSEELLDNTLLDGSLLKIR
ncbi:hypothetical protein F5882DRAFT_83252 [Hyaloscypha sp. PMI_1271]|nr:hypothetical protein F5882DRAFT_83252 [Hyaloscypha sp. PMI_1271]